MNFIYVGIGGLVGAVLRYVVSLLTARYVLLFCGIPIHTLIVNVLGSLLIGLFYALFEERLMCGGYLYLMTTVGICGGFTTFSTFSLELLSMLKTGNYSLSAIYITLSIVLSVAAVAAGYWIAHK